MNKVAIYWVIVVALCVAFPPLLGFLLGIGISFCIWWGWFKVLGG